MEEKNMRELNTDEMKTVSGGVQVEHIDFHGNPIIVECKNCHHTDFEEHGWSNEYPRGYRYTCKNCGMHLTLDYSGYTYGQRIWSW